MITNFFIRNPESTMVTRLFNKYIEEFDKNLKINIVNGLIDYGHWWGHFEKPIDIFQYIDNITLDSMRKDVNTYFLLDSSLEGYSQINSHPYAQVLYYNCDKYNIPYHKIIFVTGNLRDAEYIQKYNQENNIKNSIKVLEILAFKRSMHDNFKHHRDPYSRKPIVALRKLKNLSYEKYEDRIFLSLSRINRDHRILANFLLYSYNLKQYGLCSQDTISPNHTISHLYPIHDVKYQQFLTTLPYIVDTTDFETNHGSNMNTELYSKTLFEIANETMSDNYNGTSLFYSEKTFKPIANFQPFIIFGQQYCNQKLQDHGFKLYHDYFDYDFDNEPNTYKRYIKIIKQLQNLTIKLNQMSRDEKLAWKYQSEDILLHNFKELKKNRLEKESFFNLFEHIKKDIIITKN